MKRLLVVAALVLVAAWSGACTRISPGYVGIQVSYAGSNRGVSDYPTTNGWVLYNPIFSTVLEWPTFVQTAKWTSNLNEGKPVNEELTFTNKDGMQFAVDVSLAYHLEPDKVPHFYVKFRSDDMDVFTHGFLRNMARDKFDKNGGKYTIEEIMGDNAIFLADVRKQLQDEVAPYGVVLDQFGLIGAPRPPTAIQQAINNKAQAAQIAQMKVNELKQAEADAKKIVAKAGGDAEATRIWSEAQAAANKRMGESVTPALLELKRLEKWNGTLPYVNGAGVSPFMSLNGK
jgi:regulator of protease activity HflC (stomatin/prohibitin superfamily)